MRTTTIEYEDITIILARPSLADGKVRRQIWAALREVYGADTFGTTFLGYFVTQIVSCKGLEFSKLTACPDNDELKVLYDRFEQEMDEALYNLLSERIAVLNGYREGEKKKQSAPSSTDT